MKPVELVGMLKIDFLGLKTLTSIQMCVDAVEERVGTKIDWINLPLDDIKTFELLNQGKTLGVFQIETGGMQELARDLHLDRFEEILAVTSLYRPGPMDMIPSFINRKHGREPIEISHPWMDEILQETYGIMVYQEHVLSIASKLANYSLGEADILRRAMGKKEADKMAEQRQKFRLGCLDNGIEEVVSMAIFDKMEKFAAYGFNKSHAAAYGYLTYVTAFLKAHYPKDWMAALMTCDSHDISKIAKLVGECQSMGISLLSPDLNESNKNFFAAVDGIRFAMGGIKGLGEGVVETILQERKARGPFKSLYDFLNRMDLKKVGKKSIELMVDAGCFGFTNWTKDELRTSIDPLYETISKEKKEASLGFLNLFAAKEDVDPRFLTPPKVLKKTSEMEELFKQKELLGFFLTGHPLDHFKEVLLRSGSMPLSHGEGEDSIFRAAFLVEEIKTRFASKSQKKFAILTVSDREERVELPVWPELFEKKGEHLFENRLYLGVVEAQGKEEGRKLSCLWLEELTRVDDAILNECDREFDRAKSRSEFRKKEKPPEKKKEEIIVVEPLKIKGDLGRMRMSQILALKKLFRSHPGKRPVFLSFQVEGKEKALLSISETWGVDPSPQLIEKIKSLQFEVG
jgi:DNA polymerase-3 subunit alpha